MNQTSQNVLKMILDSSVGQSMSDADRDALRFVLETTDAQNVQGWLGDQIRKAASEGALVAKARGGLGAWFEEKWVDLSRPKEGGGFEPCGREEAESGNYPKCVPAAKAAKMSESEIASAVRRKRSAEAESNRDGKKPVNVPTFVKAKNVPTNPDLYARVKAETKRKFDVYPSAYANAWLVREYKSRGGEYRVEKGDFVGHPFRGNQHSDSSGVSQGGAGGSAQGSSRSKGPKATDLKEGDFADLDTQSGNYVGTILGIKDGVISFDDVDKGELSIKLKTITDIDGEKVAEDDSAAAGRQRVKEIDAKLETARRGRERAEREETGESSRGKGPMASDLKEGDFADLDTKNSNYVGTILGIKNGVISFDDVDKGELSIKLKDVQNIDGQKVEDDSASAGKKRVKDLDTKLDDAKRGRERSAREQSQAAADNAGMSLTNYQRAELRTFIDEQQGLLEVMQFNGESDKRLKQQRGVISQAKRDLKTKTGD